MNLDDYLLKSGVRCRETLDYLIRNGFVTVNGRKVSYSRLPLGEKDRVEILRESYMDAPATFWKLKEMDESLGLIKVGDFVLDVESRDGGFALYSARKKANVTLVTIRDDLDFVKAEEVCIVRKNVILDELEKFLPGRFDIVILELGFDVIKSMQLLEKIRPHIGSRGKLLMFLPEKGRENVKEMAEKMLLKQKLQAIEFLDARKGFYVYAKAV